VAGEKLVFDLSVKFDDCLCPIALESAPLQTAKNQEQRLVLGQRQPGSRLLVPANVAPNTARQRSDRNVRRMDRPRCKSKLTLEQSVKLGAVLVNHRKRGDAKKAKRQKTSERHISILCAALSLLD
jgi:hypothetical protein